MFLLSFLGSTQICTSSNYLSAIQKGNVCTQMQPDNPLSICIKKVIYIYQYTIIQLYLTWPIIQLFNMTSIHWKNWQMWGKLNQIIFWENLILFCK